MTEARGLAPWASLDTESRGRRFPEPGPTFRTEYQRDRDRVIHSTAFRRLVYKTQVFVNHEGDLYRTRLTHSLEVAQIARTIAGALDLNEYLIEAICLAHDLGHTPFGHAGQSALNECMRPYGGFEHNLQSLRVVDELEEKYADFAGLNLTFETREGILKHCSVANARELGPIGQRFIERTQPGLEAQVANLADEIAYNNHDVDDGLRSGLLTLDELNDVPLFRDAHRAVLERHPDLDGRRLVYEIVRRMIGLMVEDLVARTRENIQTAAPASRDAVRALDRPLAAFSPERLEQIQVLKRFLHERLYRHHRVNRMTTKARETLASLFRAFFGDPRLMPRAHANAAHQWEISLGEAGRARAVADYVAGMTDRYAIVEYERVFNPRART